MKMMHGAFFLPCSKRSRTREAPTPTNISTKSEPEIEKNGTFASPATARASSVLPVPGGPIIRTPFGMRPPSFWNFCGSFKNSMISCSSSFASSTPATSLNVTRFCWLFSNLARDLPKLRALLPPDCICRSMKIQNPSSSSTGPHHARIDQSTPPEAGSICAFGTRSAPFASFSTASAIRSPLTLSPSMDVRKVAALSFVIETTSDCLIVISPILPLRISSINCP